MFSVGLKDNLKQIFGTPKVLFDAFTPGAEQDVLFCDIDNSRDYVTQDKRVFIVDGRISLCGQAVKHKYGFLHSRIALSKPEYIAGFAFSRNEKAIKYAWNNDDYVKYEIDFIYAVSMEYNPAKNNIGSVNISLSVN